MLKKKLTLDEIKKLELKILIFFDKYCKKYGLKYYLAGGTLLGAIRHKGFIPWDDDIDVCMPRKDYEKFLQQYKDDYYYKLLTNQKISIDRPYSRLVDVKTLVEYGYFDSKLDNNIWIDIFPVDGLPEDTAKVIGIYKECDFYKKILVISDSRPGYGKTLFKKYAKYILKPLANLYGKQRCIDNIEKIAAKYPYESSKYVGIVTWGLLGAGQMMLKSEFEKSVEVEFEGHKFPAFSCWDGYLKGMYGDYMKLPPLEQRKTHEIIAYLLEEYDFTLR